MSAEIYLARHGQSEWNADADNDRLNGRTDIGLTAVGYGQAQQMARAITVRALNDHTYLCPQPPRGPAKALERS